MADKSIKFNDIKPVESFSVEGCHYFKDDEGEVHRSCLERLSWYWAEVDAGVAKGADPEKGVKKKQKMAAEVAKTEADREDTLATYKRVIEVQEGIIALFRDKIDFSKKSNKVEKTESEQKVYIPGPANDPSSASSFLNIKSIEMSFKDLDGDGNSDYLDIGYVIAQEQYLYGFKGSCAYLSRIWIDYSIGYAEYNDGNTEDNYLLSGQSFEPLISSLLAFFDKA